MTAPARLGPVLVVDDEVHLNLLVSSILKLHGCEVITAQNGQQGLDAVRERRDVKVIVTDLNMPVLDGFGMLNAVRALGVNAPVIVLTARATTATRNRPARSARTPSSPSPSRVSSCGSWSSRSCSPDAPGLRAGSGRVTAPPEHVRGEHHLTPRTRTPARHAQTFTHVGHRPGAVLSWPHVKHRGRSNDGEQPRQEACGDAGGAW